MTTFEIIVAVAIIAIVLLLLVIVIQFGVFLQRDGVLSVLVKMSSIEEKLENINGEVGQTNARIDGFIPWAKLLRQKADNLENAWACDITSIIKLLKELVDIEHKSDERNDNMFPFVQEIMRNYNPPCYAPNGICTNPQMDCINCPKRGTGGAWSTSTNAIKED